MNQSQPARLVLTVLIGLSGLLATSAAGMEWYQAEPDPTFSGPPEAAAEHYLAVHRDELGLQDVELDLQTALVAAGGVTVRFTQTHEGLPVLYSAVAVRVTKDGIVRTVIVDVATGAYKVKAEPSLQLNDVLSRLTERGEDVGVDPRGSLVVLPQGTSARLVWQVAVPALDGGWRYHVDAHNGEIVGKHLIAMDAVGRVYPINPVVTPDVQDLPLTQLDAATPQVLRGWNGLFNVTNYVSGDPLAGAVTVEQTLEPNSGEDFLYEPSTGFDATDGFSQVATFYHLTRMREYFQQTLGVPMDGFEWQLTAVANLTQQGQPFDNAYFSPEGMPSGRFAAPNMIAIGEGTIDFAYDSDVIMHEFFHYVSWRAVGYNAGQFYSNEWGLSAFSGGIDEGVADYFSSTINGDPIVSELALGALGASRDLEASNKVCPDDVWGEVHADGEIIGGITWEVRMALGDAVADQLVWAAITMLTSGATLGDFATALQAAADDLVVAGDLTDAQRAEIDALIGGRGLDDCGHAIEVSPDLSRRTTMIGMETLGQLLGVTCEMVQFIGIQLQSPFHFRVQPPADAKGLQFTAALQPLGPGKLDWNLYGRTGEHVSFAVDPNGMIGVPEVQDFDYRRRGVNEQTLVMTLDALSDPPFDPNAEYFFVAMQANCPTTWANLSVEWLYEDPVLDEPDTADAPADVGDDTATADVGSDTADAGADTAVADAGTDTNGADIAEVLVNEENASEDSCGCRVRSASTPSGNIAWFGLIGLLGLIALRRRR